MLVIREAQMVALQRGAAEEIFAARLAESLAGTFPERFADAAGQATLEFARRTIDVALRHGIATEHAVALFANLRAAYGEEFEWTPVAEEARAVLEDPELPGEIKIAAIRDILYSATGGRPITLSGEEG